MMTNRAERQTLARLMLLAFVGLMHPTLGKADPPVSFARQIQPILADKCFACHGPDPTTRKAKLRLDRQEDALAERRGSPAVTPGNLSRSEVFQRISSADADQRMPPANFGKKLTPREIGLIRQWIEQGAKWETHWAFTPPKRPAPPAVADEDGRAGPAQSARCSCSGPPTKGRAQAIRGSVAASADTQAEPRSAWAAADTRRCGRFHQ